MSGHARRGNGRAAEPPALLAPADAAAPAEETLIPQDFARLLEEAADLEPPVEVVGADRGTTYRLDGRPFAIAAGPTFDVHLGPDIAAAAVRTPDVTASSLGPGWVHLAPERIDDHAADRALAWFEMARRIAAGKRRPPDGQRGPDRTN